MSASRLIVGINLLFLFSCSKDEVFTETIRGNVFDVCSHAPQQSIKFTLRQKVYAVGSGKYTTGDLKTGYTGADGRYSVTFSCNSSDRYEYYLEFEVLGGTCDSYHELKKNQNYNIDVPIAAPAFLDLHLRASDPNDRISAIQPYCNEGFVVQDPLTDTLKTLRIQACTPVTYTFTVTKNNTDSVFAKTFTVSSNATTSYTLNY